MSNAIQPRFFLVVRPNDVPRCMLAVGCLQHLVSRTGILVPAAKRLQVHGAKLPLAERVSNPRFKSTLLLFLSDFHPILDENDPTVHHVLLKFGAEIQEPSMLFFGAKTHHVFHSGAVVPASVEDDNLPGGRKMLHVTLHVHLTFFAVGWSGQRD